MFVWLAPYHFLRHVDDGLRAGVLVSGAVKPECLVLWVDDCVGADSVSVSYPQTASYAVDHVHDELQHHDELCG
jgi:hypothetical protein